MASIAIDYFSILLIFKPISEKKSQIFNWVYRSCSDRQQLLSYCHNEMLMNEELLLTRK